MLDKVGEHLAIGVVKNRAGRDGQYEVLACLPVLDVALPVRSTFGTAVRIVPVAQQGCFVLISDHTNVATPPAGTAGRFALGAALLAEKRNNPRTTVAGAEVDVDSIDEHADISRRERLPNVDRCVLHT